MDRLRTLDMAIIGFFGGKDQGIPPEKVKEFESNLETVGRDAKIFIYDDASHAFANPSGQRYNKEAAQDAWAKTKAFLAKHLNRALQNLLSLHRRNAFGTTDRERGNLPTETVAICCVSGSPRPKRRDSR